MNERNGRGLLAAACFALAALVWFTVPDNVEAAGGAASNVLSTSVTCAPFNLLNPDAGSPLTSVTCSNGFRAVTLETESTTPAYVCGQGGTAANYTTVCRKRCVGCYNGSLVSDDAIMRGSTGAVNYRCISGTADAGVVFAVTCAQ